MYLKSQSGCSSEADIEYKKVVYPLTEKARERARKGDYESEKKFALDAVKQTEKIQKKYNCFSASAFYALSDANLHLRNYEEAKNNLIKAKQHCEKFNLDCRHSQFCLFKLGNIYLAEGNDSIAILQYNAALEICKDEYGGKVIEALTLASLGDAALKKGEIDAARQNYVAAESIAHEIGERNMSSSWVLGRCYFGMGSIVLEEGSCDEALADFQSALKLAEDVFDNKTISKCYNKIGYIFYHKSKLSDATVNFTKGIAFSQQMGHYEILVDSYIYMGYINLSLGNNTEALKYAEEAAITSKKYNLKIGLVDAYNLEGVIMRKKDVFMLISKSDEALGIAQDIKYEIGIADAYNNLSCYYYDVREYKRALNHAKLAIRIADSIGYNQVVADAYNTYGKTLIKYKNGVDSALVYFNLALKRANQGSFKKCGTYLEGKANAYNNIADVYNFKRKKDLALKNYHHALEISKEIAFKEGIQIAESGIDSQR